MGQLKFKMASITPAMARKFLSNNSSNRNIRPRKVAEYKRSMEQGFWRITGDGISLSDDGALLDGQHRLQAIIEHGKPISMAVIKGVDNGAQQYMDCGTPRRISDNLLMFDGQKNATGIVAIVKALQLFDEGVWQPMVIDEVRKSMKKYRAQFDWYCDIKTSALPTTAYFFAPLVWCHRHGWGDEVEMFVTEMATMEGLSKGSPVIALTRALDRKQGVNSGGYTTSLIFAMITFNALKAYVEDESLEASRLLPSPKGFDYFNSEIKTFPKRRKKDGCVWPRGCTFTATGPNTYCWLHERAKQKQNKSKNE